MGNQAEDSRPGDSSGSARERICAGTPEDVAALFTWANLQGARYWDFSESRRRYRQKVRECAAEVLDERRREENRAAPGLSGAAPIPQPPNSRVHMLSSRAGLSWIKEEHAGGPHFLRSQRFAIAEDFVETSRDTGKHQPALLWEPAPVRTVQELPAEDAGEVWRRSLLEEDLPRGSSSRSRAIVNTRESDSGSSARQESGLAQPPTVASRRAAWIDDETPRLTQPQRHPSFELDALNQFVFQGNRMLAGHESPGLGGESQADRAAGLAIVFSTIAGVGRTSLLATLGSALSRAGERVALGDTTDYSSLPLYFGAREVCLGLSRAFASPVRPNDPPVFIASYNISEAAANPADQRRIMAEILRNGARADRILLDLPASAEWLLRRIATLQPTVLVPIVPDVNALLTLDATERFFEPFNDSDGDALQPLYVLSQFDPMLPLHLDVREILENQLGRRLLSTVIRRSALVREALTQGLTVLDYAPLSAVAQDYMDLAGWLQTAAPAAPSLAQAGGSQ